MISNKLKTYFKSNCIFIPTQSTPADLKVNLNIPTNNNLKAIQIKAIGYHIKEGLPSLYRFDFDFIDNPLYVHSSKDPSFLNIFENLKITSNDNLSGYFNLRVSGATDETNQGSFNYSPVEGLIIIYWVFEYEN